MDEFSAEKQEEFLEQLLHFKIHFRKIRSCEEYFAQFFFSKEVLKNRALLQKLLQELLKRLSEELQQGFLKQLMMHFFWKMLQKFSEKKMKIIILEFPEKPNGEFKKNLLDEFSEKLPKKLLEKTNDFIMYCGDFCGNCWMITLKNCWRNCGINPGKTTRRPF